MRSPLAHRSARSGPLSPQVWWCAVSFVHKVYPHLCWEVAVDQSLGVVVVSVDQTKYW